MSWQDHPYKISVKAGEEKAFCSCGNTKNPPFCDGSHKGSGLRPCRILFDEDKVVSICGCGCSKNMPFCDGAHKCLRR